MTMSIEMSEGQFGLSVAPDVLDIKVASDEAPSCNIEESRTIAAPCLKRAAVIEFYGDEQHFPALAWEQDDQHERSFYEKII